MSLPDDFVCSICIDTLYGGALKRCGGCGKAFHRACLLPWLKTLGSNDWSCPACRCTPMIINDDQYIEELFAAVQNDLLVSCKFCAIKVSTHDILRDHYALCSAYQRKLAKKTYERAEFLWSLFCKITPQISFDFKYPTGRKPFIRAEITIPDRREEPQALLFVLIIRRNTKNPTEYRFDIALADKQPEPPRFPLNFGAILAFSRDELKCEVKALDHVRKIPLFHITSTRSHFRMWTYVF